MATGLADVGNLRGFDQTAQLHGSFSVTLEADLAPPMASSPAHNRLVTASKAENITAASVRAQKMTT